MQCPSCKKKIPMSFTCHHCGAQVVRRSGSVSAGSVSQSAPPLMAPPPPDMAAPMEPPPMDAAPIAAPPMEQAPMPMEAPDMSSTPISVEEPPMDMDDLPTMVDALPMAAAGVNIGAPEMAAENPYEAPEMMMPQPMWNTQALASPGSRLGAHFVDGFAVLGAYLPAFLVAVVADQGSALMSVGMILTVLAMLGLVIYQIMLLSREGQTIGKRAMNVRIVRYDDGSNPGFGRVIGLRLIVNGLIGLVPLYALVDILFIFGGEHRCLHDYIAGTKVVTA